MKKIFIGLTCFMVVLGFSGCASKPKVVLKDDIKIEYGDEISSTDLIKESESDENVDIEKIKKFESRKAGKQNISVIFTDGENTKEEDVKIEVVDSNKPVIELYEDKVTVTQGDYYDLKDNIKSINDPVDGEISSTGYGDNKYYININDVDFDKVGEYEVSVNATDVNGNETTEGFTIVVEEKPSEVYEAYITATTLTKDLLTSDGWGEYAYEDIKLLSKDCEWIDNWLNTEGTVEKGAIYRKMAKLLEGYKIGAPTTVMASHVFGMEDADREELKPYVNEASKFIVMDESPIKAVMTKFSTLKSVKGTFKHDTRSYHFTIKDIDKCAKELKISGEMLGYILAMLEEYAPEASFEKNTYTFKLN